MLPSNGHQLGASTQHMSLWGPVHVQILTVRVSGEALCFAYAFFPAPPLKQCFTHIFETTQSVPPWCCLPTWQLLSFHHGLAFWCLDMPPLVYSSLHWISSWLFSSLGKLWKKKTCYKHKCIRFLYGYKYSASEVEQPGAWVMCCTERTCWALVKLSSKGVLPLGSPCNE